MFKSETTTNQEQDLSWLQNQSFPSSSGDVLEATSVVSSSENERDKRQRKDEKASTKNKKKHHHHHNHKDKKSRKKEESQEIKPLKLSGIALNSSNNPLQRERRQGVGSSFADDFHKIGFVFFFSPFPLPSVRFNPHSYLFSLGDCYFDSVGDYDNFTFGCLNSSDVPKRLLPSCGRICFGTGNSNYSIVAKMSKREPTGIELLILRGNDPNSSLERYWKKSKQIRNVSDSDFVIEVNKLQTSGQRTSDFIPLESTNTEEEYIMTENEKMIRKEEDIQRKTRKLIERTRFNPNNIASWLEYAKLQDEYLKFGDRRALGPVLEKKLAIFQAALESNPQCEELVLEYLGVCKEAWESAKVQALWDRIIANQGTERAPIMSSKMWKQYIDFCLSKFSSFSMSYVRNVFARAIGTISRMKGNTISVDEAEDFSLELFCKLCSIEKNAGFHERSLALFQAIIEFNLFRRNGSFSFSVLRSSFIKFWDSECPRIGEETSCGWFKYIEKSVLSTSRNATTEHIEPEIIEQKTSFTWKLSGTAAEEAADKFLKELHQNLIEQSKEEDKQNESNEESDNESDSFEGKQEESDDGEKKKEESALETTSKEIIVQPNKPLPLQQMTEEEEKEFKRRVRDWCSKEDLSDNSLWKPMKTSEISDNDESIDVERVVLSKDICDFLFTIDNPSKKLELALKFLEIIGVPAPRFTCSNSPSHLKRMEDLDEKGIKAFLDQICETITKGDLEEARDWESFLRIQIEGEDRKNFCGKALSMLNEVFPDESLIAETWLIWESNVYGEKASKDLAKTLLSKRRDSLKLWQRYAQIELKAGKKSEAIRILETAFLSATKNISAKTKNVNRGDVFSLAFSLAMLYISDRNNQKAISVLLSSIGIIRNKINNAGRFSPIETISIKRAFEEQRQKFFFQTVSCQGLFEYLINGFQSMNTLFQSAFQEIQLQSPGVRELEKERLVEIFVSLSWLHMKNNNTTRPFTSPKDFLDILKFGLQEFPSNPFLSCLLFISQQSPNGGIPFSLRTFLHSFVVNRPEAICISWMLVSNSTIDDMLSITINEQILSEVSSNNNLKQSVSLWFNLLDRQLHASSLAKEAKQAFLRGIRYIPWNKHLWTECIRNTYLLNAFTVSEIRDILALIVEKELRIQSDPATL